MFIVVTPSDLSSKTAHGIHLTMRRPRSASLNRTSSVTLSFCKLTDQIEKWALVDVLDWLAEVDNVSAP